MPIRVVHDVFGVWRCYLASSCQEFQEGHRGWFEDFFWSRGISSSCQVGLETRGLQDVKSVAVKT